jgi:ribonucleoside-triphosphate reductase (thioredoxin)
MGMEISTKILSELTVFLKYAKFLPELQRRETWTEIVDRNKNMHLKKYPKLHAEIEEAYKLVYDKKVLPSMRSLQFAGKPIELNPSRIYNCSFLPMNHPDCFSELMFLLLSGVGVGYSVQTHHIEQLPEVRTPKKTRRYLIGDSIEGWADAVKVLIDSYYSGKAKPTFDFRDIRPKGAQLITSGGKAPGPEPLSECLFHIEKIFNRKNDGEKLTALDVHDINCFIADAVLSGGIRRSAMIALFNLDDEDMLTCKYGKWYENDPQRGRANNSAVVMRHKIEKDVFFDLWKKVELSNAGEPGIFFSNDKEQGLNPCAEISLKAFQFCNLTTINASDVETQEDLNARAKAAAFIGTLQAGYTNFHYLRDIWQKTTEKEALIGVSMTGIASGRVLELNLTEAATTVKDENARVAKLIGINKAARCTTVKPEGTTSLVLGSSSGIHAWHNKAYIRRVRVGKNEPIYGYLAKHHPELIEDEVFKPHLQAVISVPQRAPKGAITRNESAIELLNRVSLVWRTWVKPGHRKGSNTNNVSTTVSIKPEEWEEVGKWMWTHKDEFTALSVLPFEQHSYPQLPFEDITIKQYEELYEKLKDIDLTKVVETENNTTLKESVACGGAVGCEVV